MFKKREQIFKLSSDVSRGGIISIIKMFKKINKPFIKSKKEL
jgi:hypothetical protein